MPNQPTAEGIAALAPYWTSIVGARQQGLRSTDVWGIIQEQFQEGGPSPQGASIFDMNHYWQRAGEYISAGAAFGAEPGENVITGEMWSWAPWAVPTVTDWQVPNYMINYARGAVDAQGELLTDANGDPIPVYGAYLNDGPLPDLAGDVNGLVQTSSEMSLDTGSPRMLAQLGGAGGTGLGPILSVNIMRF